jgi:hypothetical protein
VPLHTQKPMHDYLARRMKNGADSIPSAPWAGIPNILQSGKAKL